MGFAFLLLAEHPCNMVTLVTIVAAALCSDRVSANSLGGRLIRSEPSRSLVEGSGDPLHTDCFKNQVNAMSSNLRDLRDALAGKATAQAPAQVAPAQAAPAVAVAPAPDDAAA